MFWVVVELYFQIERANLDVQELNSAMKLLML